MATDIHLHFEKREGNDWVPLHISVLLLPLDRDYEVFGFLEGIRCTDFVAQFPGRGVPKDSSFEDHKDLHNHTYAYLDEIRRAPWDEAGLQFRYFPIFCSHVLPRLVKDSPMFSDEEERNLRCVMAFDS